MVKFKKVHKCHNNPSVPKLALLIASIEWHCVLSSEAVVAVESRFDCWRNRRSLLYFDWMAFCPTTQAAQTWESPYYFGKVALLLDRFQRVKRLLAW